MRNARLAGHRQRGTAYILVLGITTLLVTLGLTATQLAKGQIASSDTQRQQTQARLHALSAQDYVHKRISGSLSWRDDVSEGVWYRAMQGDGVVVDYAYADPIDGNLTDSYSEPFLLYTRAISGDVQRGFVVEYTADEAGNLTRNASSLRPYVIAR